MRRTSYLTGSESFRRADVDYQAHKAAHGVSISDTRNLPWETKTHKDRSSRIEVLTLPLEKLVYCAILTGRVTHLTNTPHAEHTF